jgi:hypothetical protein
MPRLAALVVATAIVTGCGEEAKPTRPAKPDAGLPPAVSIGEMATVAGGGTELGDGEAARSARLCGPSGFAVDGDGNLYVSDAAYECGGPGGKTIRKIATDGTITTVAGTGRNGHSGDGGPALKARIDAVDVAFDDDGNLYLADYEAGRVRMVDENGIIKTVAGSRRTDRLGDGDPATKASLAGPVGVAVDRRGTCSSPSSTAAGSEWSIHAGASRRSPVAARPSWTQDRRTRRCSQVSGTSPSPRPGSCTSATRSRGASTR